MTDINSGQYTYRQLYPQYQQGYGDSNIIPDKHAEKIKNNLNSSAVGRAVGSTVDTKENGTKKMAVTLGLGAVASLIADQGHKLLLKGKTFEESLLGRAVKSIDDYTGNNKFLSFKWLGNAWKGLKERSGLVRQIADAPVEPPRWVKGMVAPIDNKVVHEYFTEAMKEATNISDNPKELKKILKAHFSKLEKPERQALVKKYRDALKASRISRKNEALRTLFKSLYGKNADVSDPKQIKEILKGSREAIRKLDKPAKQALVAKYRAALKAPRAFRKNEALQKLYQSIHLQDMNNPENIQKTLRDFKEPLSKLSKRTRKAIMKDYTATLKASGKAEALEKLHRAIFSEGIHEIRDPKFVERAYQMAESIAAKSGSSSKYLDFLRSKATSALAAKTPISKTLVKGLNMVGRFLSPGNLFEALKNAKGGIRGKLGVISGLGLAIGGFLLNSYFIGDMVKETVDAPKKEKVSTFAHSMLVEFIAGWVMMDPIIGSMYKGIGILRNIGKKGAKEAAKEGFKLSHLITKPLNKVGDLLSTGLHTEPLKKLSTDASLGKKFWHYFTLPARSGWKTFKEGIGAVGRFALVSFGMFPLMDKIAGPPVHLIFGTPKTLLAKKEAEEKDEKSKEQPKNKMITVEAKNTPNHLKDIDLNAQSKPINPMVQRYLNMHKPNKTHTPHSVSPYVQKELDKERKELAHNRASSQKALAGTEIKLSDIKPELNELPQDNKRVYGGNTPAARPIQPKYSYIPSDVREPNKKSGKEQQQKFNAAMAKTDRVIDEAQRVL